MKKISIVLLVLLASCSGHTGNREDIFKGVVHKGEKAIAFSSLEYDTVRIDGSRTSLLGKWYVSSDSLYYLDEIVACGFTYDKNGNLGRRIFSEGRGPNEVLGPATFFTNLRDGGCIYAVDINLYRFDRDYRKIADHMFLSETYDQSRMNDLFNHPDYRDPAMYELDVWYSETEQLGDNVVFPITTELKTYNGYEGINSKSFYRNSYTMALLDLETLKLVKMFGGYPPVYRNSNIPSFKYYSMDAMDDKLYVCFSADPNIYVWDKEGTLSYSFGYPVDDMPEKYPVTTSFSQYEEMEDGFHEDYGHYTYVRCAGNHIFRNYVKGDEYGMQIYDEKHNLIGDVGTVPQFEVIGFISPYYYAVSKQTDYESEVFTVYRFKL